MSNIQTSPANRAERHPVSPQTFIAIAEEAVAAGDIDTAVQFIEMVYQIFDEMLDVPAIELAA